MSGATVSADFVPEDRPIRLRPVPSAADRTFRLLCAAMATTSLTIVLVTLYFLVDKSRPAFHRSGIVDFFTKSQYLQAIGKFGVLGILENTILIALIALIVGSPVAIGLAIFINEYAPARVRSVMTGAIDLLAAVPSIIFGLWGYYTLEKSRVIVNLSGFFTNHLNAIPIFRTPTDSSGGSPVLKFSTFAAGLVVGIMIIPIVASISRDVMSQVPREQCEGALALGGTRWGMVRHVVLPFGRSGIVGGVILGLGHALGETIAILYLVSQIYTLNSNVLTKGSGSVASVIANNFQDASPLARSGLVAFGLALFILTFLVNMGAVTIVNRSRRNQ